MDEIRAWARENGHTVGERGRLPKNIIEAYQNHMSEEITAEINSNPEEVESLRRAITQIEEGNVTYVRPRKKAWVYICGWCNSGVKDGHQRCKGEYGTIRCRCKDESHEN